MKKSALIALLGTIALLAACSNQHEAGKNEFKKAINQAVQQHNVCLPVSLELVTPQAAMSQTNVWLGTPEIRINERDFNGDRINKEALNQMDTLLSANLYQLTNTEKTMVGESKLRTRVYTLTDKGQTQVQTSPQGPLLCLGKEEVKTINWYTEPTPSNGVTVSKVSYQAEFKPESWVKKLLKDDSQEWQQLNETRNQTATMVKTSDGWRDIHELH